MPQGKEVEIGGRSISGGMLYTGRNLPAVSEWNGIEPALIDPELRRNDKHPIHDGEGMPYWPSYSAISPGCRSAYIDWLANGRSRPGAYMGYVFLYFYGLERRALHDAKELSEAKAEIPAIEAEVRRLLSVYGDNRSFTSYASGFLDVLQAKYGEVQTGTLAEVMQRVSWVPPLLVRMAIANYAIEESPLPSDWALAWVISNPEMQPRTPARRCRKEFAKLFQRLYQERYGDGIKLRVCKRKIRVDYSPASASFSGFPAISTALPDVMSLVGPQRKLNELVDTCCDRLDPYSRWLGRNPEGQDTLEAAAYLPKELLETDPPDAFCALRESIEAEIGDDDYVIMKSSKAIGPWLPSDGRQTKKNAVEAAQLLSRVGLGLEPDVRFSGHRVSKEDQVVIFRLGEDEPDAPTATYTTATLILHLAALVSSADGEIAPEEEQHLRDHVASVLHLLESERRRLHAYLTWLLVQPPGTAGMKKRLKTLALDMRMAIGRFLISVAWADGRIEPGEVKSLTKIFRLLELDPGNVHQWLHDIQTGGSVPADPVRVRAAEPEPKHRIDRPSPEERKPASHVSLDMEAVQAKIRESAAVSVMLSRIFSDDEPPQLAAIPTTEKTVGELDGVHSTLLLQLGEKASWPRNDYEKLAAKVGVMPDGALDVLNEAAYDTCNDSLLEGDDPIEVKQTVYQEMLS